jgi:hypothetical protein
MVEDWQRNTVDLVDEVACQCGIVFGEDGFPVEEVAGASVGLRCVILKGEAVFPAAA